MPTDPGTSNCKGFAFIQVNLTLLFDDFHYDCDDSFLLVQLIILGA